LILFFALIIINSLAIAIDLGISFVGLTISVILYYSIKIANKPADMIHNYGYGKIEHVCEMLEGFVLIGIAMAMSSQAIISLLHPKQINLPLIGMCICLVNVAINFGGAYYILKMAEKSGSPAIKAEGIHYRMEGVISLIIGFSFIVIFILTRGGFTRSAEFIDPIAAILVSLFLVVPSFKIARASFFKLLDASIEEDSQLEILKPLAKFIHKYCEFKDLKSRTSGRNKFIEMKVVVPEDISLRRGYDIVSSLENEIKKRIGNCEVMVKMEPCMKDCEYIKNNKGCPYV